MKMCKVKTKKICLTLNMKEMNTILNFLMEFKEHINRMKKERRDLEKPLKI